VTSLPFWFRIVSTAIAVFPVFVRDSLLGYGLANTIKSKSATLPLFLLIEPSGVIVGLELLDTPDPNSARLQSAGWKKQFVGKSRDQLQRIDAISGATISSNDVAKGVKRLLAFARISGLLSQDIISGRE